MIRALLFDMGNVLIHFSHDRMYEQLGKLVGRSGAETRLVCEQSAWLGRCDLRTISDDELAEQVGGLFGVNADPATLWRAVSDIFWRNESIEPVIERLSTLKLPMVMVSNTCSAHIRWVIDRFEVLHAFPHKVLSYEVGAAKPSPAIFRAAVQAAGCSPGQCLFVDDFFANVAGARQFGFDAIHYENTASLVQELLGRGIAVA